MDLTESVLKDYVARLKKEQFSRELLEAARSNGINDALRLTYLQFLAVHKADKSLKNGESRENIYDLCRTYDDKIVSFSVKVECVEEGKGFEGEYRINVSTIESKDPVFNLSKQTKTNYIAAWYEGFMSVLGYAQKEKSLFV